MTIFLIYLAIGVGAIAMLALMSKIIMEGGSYGLLILTITYMILTWPRVFLKILKIRMEDEA